MKTNEKEVLVVLTSEVMDDFASIGGTSTWKLNPKRGQYCDYVICVHNRGTRDKNHGKGFLVGRVSKIEESIKGKVPWKKIYEEKPGKLYTIYFSEYAEINVPKFWGEWRNPIRYLGNDKVLLMLDIKSFDELTFKPLPASSHTVEQEKSIEKQDHKKSGALDDAQGLTIDQAKAGIALRMGISPQNIEIKIMA